MAKIPTGNFGYRLPQGGDSTPMPQVDNQVGDAQVRVGNTLSSISQAATVRRDRRLAEEEREQKAAAERAAQAKTALAHVNIQNDLADGYDAIAADVQSGKIDQIEATARWKDVRDKAVSGNLEAVPEDRRPLLSAQAKGVEGRLTNNLFDTFRKRDDQDAIAGVMAAEEGLLRLAPRDLPGAIKQHGMLIDGSPLPPDVKARQKQAFAEKATYTQAFTMVNSAKRSNAELNQVEQRLASDEFASLDPQRRAQLQTTVDGYKFSNEQRAEAQARRVQAEQERYLRNAEAEFNAANAIVSSGKQLSPEYVQRVSAATAGTPYAVAFRESLKDGPATAAFGSQSLAVQQRALIEARNQLNTRGTTPDAEKRVAQLQKIYDQAAKDYAEDPLLAAQERGVIQQVQPLDMRDINAVVSGLGQRSDQASLVQQQVGQPVSPLLKSEAEAVGKMISALPVERRASAVASIADAVGSAQAAALGRQMAPKDKALGIALGMAGAMTTEGRYTSEIVLRGDQAIRDRAVKEDNTALTGVRAHVVQQIGTAYQNEEHRQAMIDAAVFAEYGLQSEGSGNIRRAVRLVTGGIAERGGQKVPLPYGMTDDQFDQRLRQLSPVDLKTGSVVIDGKKMSAYDFLAKVPDAALIHAGQGRYAVQAGSGIAAREDGQPLIIEVK